MHGGTVKLLRRAIKDEI